MLRARYFTRLRTVIRDMRALLERELIPALPRLVDEGAAARGAQHQAKRTDAKPKTPAEIVDAVSEELGKKWTRTRFKSLVQPIASDTARFNANVINKQLEAVVGVDVVGNESWLAPMLDAFANENVALIRTISSEAFSAIEQLVTRGLADGDRWEDLSDQIQERLGVAESDANRIARDQVGKLNGDLNRVRQTDLGLSRYTWRTVEDNRVRPSHEARDGEMFDWDSPPGDPSDPGDYGHPGEAIQCRCYPEPDIEGLLEDLDL